ADINIPRTAETVHEGPRPSLAFFDVAPLVRDDFGHTASRAHPAGEQRQTPRHAVRRPLLAIPLLADGSPDWRHRCLGLSVDVSIDGLGLELDRPIELPTLSKMVVLQAP